MVRVSVGELNVVVLQNHKTDEVYTFTFSDDRVKEVLMHFGRYASNPDLSFTWYDATVCSYRVREMMKARRT